MNFENQTRLIHIREQNPQDTFNLIYDSSLLNEKAKEELATFCSDNNIVPVDADEFPAQLETEEQKELYAFYKDEITHLKEGGNLGVASDILRVLPPSYRRGIYTDLDVPVDTRHLPKTVTVHAPLVLNIGSLRLFSKKEMMFILNEYIAVADEEAAKAQLSAIQTGMLCKLKNYSSDYIEQAEKLAEEESFLNNTLLGYMQNRAEYSYISKANDLPLPDIENKTSRAYRAFVNEVMTDQGKYLDFHARANPQTGHKESHAQVLQRLRNDIRAQRGWIKWLFFRKEYDELSHLLASSDEQLVQALMKKERSLYLKSIVVCTTGPIEMTRSFFGKCDLTPAEVETRARPAAFSHYNLHKAFLSRNVIPLHQNVWGMLRYLGADVGELNDSSWLDEGQDLQKSRNERLLEKQQRVKKSMPERMATAKSNVRRMISNLRSEAKTFFGSFFVARKAAKIHKLEKVLQCFEANPDEFDIDQFKTLLGNIKKQQGSVYAGIISHRTQTLIEELEAVCTEAVVLRVADNKKLPVAAVPVATSQAAKAEPVPANPGTFFGFFANTKPAAIARTEAAQDYTSTTQLSGL